MLQTSIRLISLSSATTAPNNKSLPLISFTSPLNKQQCQQQWQLKQPRRKSQFARFCTSYEVGGGYPDEESELRDRNYRTQQKQQLDGGQKMDSAKYEAILKGGEQVTSVLQEMITLLEDMNMDEASEDVAVELAAQGVIGKRVDEMEPSFMMALDS